MRRENRRNEKSCCGILLRGGASRENDVISSHLDARGGGPLNNERLLVSGDAPGILPTLDSGRGFADHFSHFANAAEASEQGGVGFHGSTVYDNIVQYATIISHRQCSNFSRKGGVETLNARLKALRMESGLSVRALANGLGMPPSTYSAYEDPAKFKKPILPLDLAKKIADKLEVCGIDRGRVMELAGLTGEYSGMTISDPTEQDEWLEVTGAVAAGVWRAETDWPASERYYVRFGPSKYPKEHRGAVRMEGTSMNRTIQPGADLEFLWVKFSPVEPRAGDLVIVERHRHDLVELTCKRLAMYGDDFELHCESYEPEYQEPIKIGRPDGDLFTDDEVRVVGIVLSAKLDLAPRDLSERRYRS